jgi:DEAD/DEAH box helicase domain-containing protein
LGQALETVATLALMCDPRDLGQSLGDGEQELEEQNKKQSEARPAGREPVRIGKTFGRDARIGELDPTLFIFDAQPGGVGLSERIYELAPQLFTRAQQLMRQCPCEAGCPACVGPTENSPRKKLAIQLCASLGLGLRTQN